MQKSNNKASILIWATFLSLIITVTFISISTSINKNLKNNSLLTNEFKLENEIKNIINSGSINKNHKNIILSNGDKIIFEQTNIKNISIKKGETHTGKILSNSNITIKIINGGPVYYKYRSYSGIIDIQGTISEDSNNTGSFIITNLAGYTKIQISSDKTYNYLSQYRKYTIYKKIGNKEVIKNKGLIKNF